MPEQQDKLSQPRNEKGIRSKTVLTEDGHRETLYDLDSVKGAALDEHERTVKRGMKANDELLEKAREVTAAIDYLTTELRGPWAEFQDYIKLALSTVREQRIALGSETRLLMSSLKDVRQFFLEPTYETEINRLHEFVDVCERLKALKDSGFLDTIADTILKLEVDK